MHASALHVVTAVANPLRWQSRMRLYRDFEQHMLASGRTRSCRQPACVTSRCAHAR